MPLKIGSSTASDDNRRLIINRPRSSSESTAYKLKNCYGSRRNSTIDFQEYQTCIRSPLTFNRGSSSIVLKVWNPEPHPREFVRVLVTTLTKFSSATGIRRWLIYRPGSDVRRFHFSSSFVYNRFEKQNKVAVSCRLVQTLNSINGTHMTEVVQIIQSIVKWKIFQITSVSSS